MDKKEKQKAVVKNPKSSISTPELTRANGSTWEEDREGKREREKEGREKKR